MRWLTIGAGLLLAACTLPAQVSLELNCRQEQYVLGEPVAVVARIGNQSGRLLELGGDDQWLAFAIEAKGGVPVARTGKLTLPGAFKVDSAQTARVGTDLEPAYQLDKPGNYKVTAILRLPGWQQQVESRPVNFSIIRGTTLWEQNAGLPADHLATNTNRPPEVRRFTVLQANTTRQIRLYVRLSDPVSERIIAAFPVGPMASFARPECQLDRFSNLHLIYQDGARSFSYLVVNPSGRVGLREAYDIADSRPRLKGDEEGRISVFGGERRITADPLADPPITTNAPPVVTNAPAGAKAAKTSKAPKAKP